MPKPGDVPRSRDVSQSKTYNTGEWDGYKISATASGSERSSPPPGVPHQGFVEGALEQLERLNLRGGSSRGDAKGKESDKMEEMIEENIWYNVWEWHNLLCLDFNEQNKQISNKRVKVNADIRNAKKMEEKDKISKEAAKEIYKEGESRLLKLDNEEEGVDHNRKYLEEIKIIYLFMANNGYKITKVHFSPKFAAQKMLGPFSIDTNIKRDLEEIGVKVDEDETAGRTTISFDLERKSLRRLKSKLMEIAGTILDKKLDKKHSV
ncbi:hypothetical protein KSF_070860 [Reticulibacter mediterranei]|uniref:Uncharacterized protein n=1 Tax=Reticulibacter mediterranei TaxID=2778369 RepID=A0A8J3IMZ0_9CHLR|nr:hypothetical protein [Reticulibacter mediterranei]GHO97038.1 hypothetical protein KSF_070860 [Reticulibacter mediterranei]